MAALSLMVERQIPYGRVPKGPMLERLRTLTVEPAYASLSVEPPKGSLSVEPMAALLVERAYAP